MGTKEFRLSKGARVALYIAGALCVVLVFALPFGVWIIYRAATGKVTLSDKEVVARALLTTRVDLTDVSRLGILRVPVAAKGLGGALARQKVGGDEAINVCAMTRAGKTKKFVVSQFEDHAQITEQISKQLGMPYETLAVGMLGMKWPDKAVGSGS